MSRLCLLFCFLLNTVIGLVSASGLLAQQSFFDQAQRRIEKHRQTDFKIKVVDADGQPVAGAKVAAAMTKHEFLWGTAVVASRINSDSPENQSYKQKLLENFNAVVFENDFKWPAWAGAWGDDLGWEPAQKAMEWIDANGLPMRGHYASWATLSGDDGFGPNNQSTDNIQKRLFDHIKTKLTTVGTRVTEWDVINHPVGWGPDTYEDKFGLPFYADIIKHARSVAPRGVELWMNEDKILNRSDVSDEYERVLKYLLANDAAVDGIGFQGHFKSSWGRNEKDTPMKIYGQMERFAKIVPRLQITEFDIDVGKYDKDEKLVSYDPQEHADLMRKYLVSAFSHPQLEAITMWGFWEEAHWAPSAALFSTDWSARPALQAYRDLVYDKWWTKESGTTAADGTMQVRGYKGSYEILVQHAGKTYSQPYTTEESVATIVTGR